MAAKKRKREDDEEGDGNSGSESRLNVLRHELEENIVKDGCWNWIGKLTDGKIPRRRIKSGRYNYRNISHHLHTGEALNLLTIKMNCRNSLCLNPEHMLFVSNNHDFATLTDNEILYYKTSLERNSEWRDGHQIWTAFSDEYGKTNVGARHFRAHVFSWCLENKTTIPENKIVRHKCENKLCIAPNCLEIGTYEENAHDRIRDGTALQGSKAPNTSLTEEVVLEIFKSKDSESQSERARRFNTTKGIIKHIDRGRSWTHVTGIKTSNPKFKPRDLTSEDFDKILDTIKKNVEITADNHWLWKKSLFRKGYGNGCHL